MGETNEALLSQLESIKTTVLPLIQSQLVHPTDRSVCAEELGELMDIVKDASEAKMLEAQAEYYCSVVKAMENGTKEREDSDKIETAILMNQLRTQADQNYYGGPKVHYPSSDWDGYDRMYYDGHDNRRGGMNSSMEKSYTVPIHDYREGKSPMSRKGYMEAKEMHMDKGYQTQELEKYMKELSEDVTEMISDASPEDKKLLKERLNTLVQKIV